MATTTITAKKKTLTVPSISSPVTTSPMAHKPAEDMTSMALTGKTSSTTGIPSNLHDILKTLQDTMMTMVKNQETTSKGIEELKSDVTVVRDELRQMNVKMEEMNVTMVSHGKRIVEMETKVGKVEEKVMRLETRQSRVNRKLEDELIFMEMDRAAFFIQFQNILEDKDEDLDQIMTDMVAEITGKDREEVYRYIDETFRVYTSYARCHNLPKEVHVCCTKKTLCDEVLQKVRDQKITYKGREIIILRQLPKRVREIRKNYEFLTKRLQKMGIRYRWLLPDGLIISWQDKRIRIEDLRDTQEFFDVHFKADKQESEEEIESESQEELLETEVIKEQKALREQEEDQISGGLGSQMMTRQKKKRTERTK